jgi:PAS domain S-box-containing protein
VSSKKIKLESLLEAVPDALVGMDRQGVIRFVNRQSESLFGYDRDQLIGQQIEMLVPESLWQIYVAHRDDYFADPRTRSTGLDVELSGRQHDGTEFPINISLSTIDTGDVLLVITAVRDVTRHRQAIRNAQLIAAIVKYSDDAISSSTLAGVITSWNPGAERMYGYSSKEIIGRSGSLLTPKGRDEEMAGILTRIRAGQPVEHFESTLARKDGTLVPVSLTVSPICDEDGAVVGACAVHRDVTEQRQAFEAAQRIASIVEYSQDAILGRTPDGIITSWNHAAQRMFGYSREEMVGKSVGPLIPEDRVGEAEAVMAQVSAGQPVEELETIGIRENGTLFPISLTVSPIQDENGGVVGASVICRDVSEVKRVAQYARGLIEADPDPLGMVSPEGTIIDVNEATVQATGVPRDQLIGTDFSQYFTDPDTARQGVQQAFTKGSLTDGVLTVRHRDGTLTDYLCNAVIYRDISGEVLGVLTSARDMTKHKEAFEAAQRIAAIVESSDDAIIGKTPDGIITSWNPASERLYGYSRAEIVGKSVELLCPKDRIGELKAILARVKAGEHVKQFETIRVRKDGTVFPVSLTVSPIRDIDRRVVGASATSHDVTEQRQTLVVAQRLAQIVQDADDAIISGSLDGLITSWNPAAERMYGYSAAEVVGKPAKFLTPKDRKQEIKAVLEKIKAGQHVEQLETKRVRKGGTVFPVALTVSPIRDADGAVVGTSAIHRDLTEQRGALAVAQRMAAIVESSDDAIIGRTLDGMITSWNPAAERMFGYSSKEIVGKHIDLLVPQDRAGEMISILAKISAGRGVDNFETIRIRKDGTVFPVSLTVSPICDADGAVAAVSVICRDVSELKHAAQYARSLIEASLDPLVTISSEGTINDVNEAAVKATGVSRTKLIGTEFSGYFTDPDKARQGYDRVRTQGPVTDYPLTLRHHDGTLTDVLCNVSVYRDTAGKVLGLLAVARDMTRQIAE